jgi:hypothetical protein
MSSPRFKCPGDEIREARIQKDRKYTRVAPPIEPDLFRGANDLAAKLKAGVERSLNVKEYFGTTTFDHVSSGGGLSMRCGAAQTPIYSGEVYKTIQETFSNQSSPMLARALTQYLVHKAMIRIGDGTCAATSYDLTTDILADLKGPVMKDGRKLTGTKLELLEILNCIHDSLGIEHIDVSDENLNTIVVYTDPYNTSKTLEFNINDIQMEFVWIALHLLMSYANVIAINEGRDVDHPNQSDLDALLGPFRAANHERNGRVRSRVVGPSM